MVTYVLALLVMTYPYESLHLWTEGLRSTTKSDHPQKLTKSRELVAYVCNPGYSGGRDQEDPGSKPAGQIVPHDTISKNPLQKKGWWSGSRCRP
jgi:hypothetical protein